MRSSATEDIPLIANTESPIETTPPLDTAITQQLITEPTEETQAVIVREDVSLRDEFVKHFEMSDGSYTATVYNEPVHQLVDGAWVEVDNSLQLSISAKGVAQYKTVDGLTDVSFAQSYHNELVTMEQDNYSITWGVEAIVDPMETAAAASAQLIGNLREPVQAEILPLDLSAVAEEEQKVFATKATSTIQYADALANGVDLEYTVLPSRIKESIILNNPQSISAYTVTIKTSDLSARLLDNREVEFYTEDGETIFTMWAPYMYDSASELSEDIEVELKPLGNGQYTVILTPDADWLNSPDRVYPIVIDPDFVYPSRARTNIIDNTVMEGQGNQNRNLDRLYIGKKSGACVRAFLKYDVMPTIPSGATITAATQTLYITSGTETGSTAGAYIVTDGDWSSDTITWANRPAARTTIQASISHNNFSYYRFSCLSAVQKWYTGSTVGKNANYGITVRYTDETINDYNAFYSADYSDESSRPLLQITYQLPTSTVTILEGSTYQLSLSGVPGTISWTSNKNSVATVNSSGRVTGVRAGSATISASVDGKVQKSFTIYVKLADGVYYIKNYASSYYMSTENGGISYGTRIVQASKSASATDKLSQLWKIQYISDGLYCIRPLHKQNMGISGYSSPSLMIIGTNNTYEDSYSKWSISWATNGYVFNNSNRAGYALCTSSTTNDGAYVNIASYANGTVFRWTLEKETSVANQVLLLNSQSGAPIENVTQCVKLGKTVTLANMAITASFVSAYSTDQSITWSTLNNSVVSVNSSTGAVTGLSAGKTATITATHTYNGVNYQKSYTIYVSKADEYIFQVVNYYDSGYNLREGNAASAIKSYHDTVSSRFNSIFGINLVESIESYNSSCDNCKIQCYGGVSTINLDSPCNHSSQCLGTEQLRNDLLSKKGAGNATKTVISWSGHRMTNYEDDRSNSVSLTHSVIMTTYGINDWSDTDDKAVDRTYTLMHELSHQLAAPDHYCYGPGSTGRCSNKSCDECYLGYTTTRDCLMGHRCDISTISDNELYCDDCVNAIKSHLKDHH